MSKNRIRHTKVALRTGGPMSFAAQPLEPERMNTVRRQKKVFGMSTYITYQGLDHNLSDIVNQLMSRFNSRDGYKAFDDAIPTSELRYFCASMSLTPYKLIACAK